MSYRANQGIIPQKIGGEPRWLSLREACRYGHIGRDRLIALINDGVIAGFKDPDSGRGDYIVDRFSIDEYRENQVPVAIRKKALEIVRSL